MKRIFAMFAVLALMAGMAMAAPSMYGSNGLIRLISAQNSGPMSFGIGFHGVAWMKDSTVTHPYSDKNAEIYPEIYFAFNDMFELSVAPKYNYYRNDPWTASAGGKNGLFDTRVGLKVSYKASDMMALGLYGGYDIPTQGMMDSLLEVDTPAVHNGIVHAKLLTDLNFGAAKVNVNLGFGYKLDKTNDTTSVYPNIGFPFGIGFSYKTQWVTPFLEVTGKAGIDSNTYYSANGSATYETGVKRGLLNNPLLITPGLRFTFPFGMNFDLAFDYNIQAKDTLFKSPYDPNSTNPIIAAAAAQYKLGYAGTELNKQYDWQIVAGLSYAPCQTTGPKVPVTALLTGKVTDAKGKGLAATVTAGGLTANTDPATGVYNIAGLPITKAPMEIKAVAKLYIAKSASVILTKKNKKTPAVQDFALDLKPIPMGAAKGMVKDAMGAPVEASIAFAGPKAETAKAVAGAYNANLQAGNYTATVTAAGYFDKMATIAITEKGTAMNDFAMLKKGAVVPVEVVWTAANKAMIKTVNVESLVKMIQDNPKAKVVITANVDRVGGKKMNQKLATDRADAVRAELVKAAIDAARITTVGQLVVPAGKTNAARAANTKVEVSFVE